MPRRGCCCFDRALELLDCADALNGKRGGDERVAADLAELRSAVTESKDRWDSTTRARTTRWEAGKAGDVKRVSLVTREAFASRSRRARLEISKVLKFTIFIITAYASRPARSTPPPRNAAAGRLGRASFCRDVREPRACVRSKT